MPHYPFELADIRIHHRGYSRIYIQYEFCFRFLIHSDLGYDILQYGFQDIILIISDKYPPVYLGIIKDIRDLLGDSFAG